MIDEEQFITEMENNIGNIYNPDIIKGMRFAIDLIKSRSTAYDVDKVVGQITDLNDNEFTYARVVAVIRAGGVNESNKKIC